VTFKFLAYCETVITLLYVDLKRMTWHWEWLVHTLVLMTLLFST